MFRADYQRRQVNKCVTSPPNHDLVPTQPYRRMDFKRETIVSPAHVGPAIAATAVDGVVAACVAPRE
ncbi:hypothetical protein BVI434_980026 [Burkholderia vietnamiensis]|nr:hypothetical protein BVI434_980026 [Burkholderia vietnamiensis]